MAERDENTARKEMLPSEKTALGMAIQELEAPAAKERQREAGREFGKGIASVPGNTSYAESDKWGHKTRDIAAEAVGLSPATFTRMKTLVTTAADENEPDEVREAAREAVEAIDQGAPSTRSHPFPGTEGTSPAEAYLEASQGADTLEQSLTQLIAKVNEANGQDAISWPCRGTRSARTPGGAQVVSVINESGRAILGISKYRDAIAQLAADERVSVAVDTPGGRQQMAAVMLISRSARARDFKRWVTHEVLPQIRAAIDKGDLPAKYPNRKPIITLEAALKWIESLPDEAPRRAS